MKSLKVIGIYIVEQRVSKFLLLISIPL